MYLLTSKHFVYIHIWTVYDVWWSRLVDCQLRTAGCVKTPLKANGSHFLALGDVCKASWIRWETSIVALMTLDWLRLIYTLYLLFTFTFFYLPPSLVIFQSTESLCCWWCCVPIGFPFVQMKNILQGQTLNEAVFLHFCSLKICCCCGKSVNFLQLTNSPLIFDINPICAT